MTDVKALTEAQLDEIERKVADQAKRYLTVIFDDTEQALSLVSMARRAADAEKALEGAEFWLRSMSAEERMIAAKAIREFLATLRAQKEPRT